MENIHGARVLSEEEREALRQNIRNYFGDSLSEVMRFAPIADKVTRGRILSNGFRLKYSEACRITEAARDIKI
jgi:hypothetical protein